VAAAQHACLHALTLALTMLASHWQCLSMRRPPPPSSARWNVGMSCTAHHSPFIAHNSPPFTTTHHHSPRTTHHAPLTTHHSPSTTHLSTPRTTHHSPRTTHHSPLTTFDLQASRAEVVELGGAGEVGGAMGNDPMAGDEYDTDDSLCRRTGSTHYANVAGRSMCGGMESQGLL
jgi:hypothetical protein